MRSFYDYLEEEYVELEGKAQRELEAARWRRLIIEVLIIVYVVIILMVI